VTAVYQQKDLDHFDVIAQSLEENLHIEARRAGFFEITDTGYNSLRKQYNPEQIIKILSALSQDQEECRIGVIDVDIYARGLNFIFGLANPVRKIALVSIYRLSGHKLEERLAKEAVHEMGHLLGLNHCSDRQCVMYFSNTVLDTDNKSAHLCAICRSKYER
jgi:archaemetzincin